MVDLNSPEPRILMGKRRTKASFIPDAYVFPGGGLEKADETLRPVNELRPEIRAQLGGDFGLGKKPFALPNAAIRETFEETGLIIGSREKCPPSEHPSWKGFAESGFAPDHHQIGYLGRAITPTASPIRFHARFFITTTEHVTGEIAGSGELLNVDFYPLSKALELPIIDVTEFMLNQVKERLSSPLSLGSERPNPLFTYRNQKPYIRYL